MQSYYRIGLDDLLGRDLTVQWFEGVAIIQEVCRQILADGSAQRGFPALRKFSCALMARSNWLEPHRPVRASQPPGTR